MNTLPAAILRANNFHAAQMEALHSHQARIAKACDELHHQIYQAGGAVEHVPAFDTIAATQARGFSRDEAIEAMNELHAEGSIECHETFTGMIDTLKIND